jgi:hypothetical protein
MREHGRHLAALAAYTEKQAVAKHLAVPHRAGLVNPQPGAPPCQLLEPGQAT